MYSDAKTCHFGETVLPFDCTFYKQSLFRENYAFRENLTHTHAQSDSSEFHADEKIRLFLVKCPRVKMIGQSNFVLDQSLSLFKLNPNEKSDRLIELPNLLS